MLGLGVPVATVDITGPLDALVVERTTLGLPAEPEPACDVQPATDTTNTPTMADNPGP